MCEILRIKSGQFFHIIVNKNPWYVYCENSDWDYLHIIKIKILLMRKNCTFKPLILSP